VNELTKLLFTEKQILVFLCKCEREMSQSMTSEDDKAILDLQSTKDMSDGNMNTPRLAANQGYSAYPFSLRKMTLSYHSNVYEIVTKLVDVRRATAKVGIVTCNAFFTRNNVLFCW
jgi:ABC-type transport system involved in Fe-S cluster assembly fused permease/ATPase subunit